MVSMMTSRAFSGFTVGPHCIMTAVGSLQSLFNPAGLTGSRAVICFSHLLAAEHGSHICQEFVP
ncbi:hypothetical protein KSP39_PZI004385 [Platanthera zijinensis]|uniref:Uncharacterized protein n=1 Tax=Platanthera zijinensis TaxID=2320716 RepID=A0AAP0BVC5_9ASPA